MSSSAPAPQPDARPASRSSDRAAAPGSARSTSRSSARAPSPNPASRQSKSPDRAASPNSARRQSQSSARRQGQNLGGGSPSISPDAPAVEGTKFDDRLLILHGARPGRHYKAPPDWSGYPPPTTVKGFRERYVYYGFGIGKKDLSRTLTEESGQFLAKLMDKLEAKLKSDLSGQAAFPNTEVEVPYKRVPSYKPEGRMGHWLRKIIPDEIELDTTYIPPFERKSAPQNARTR
ncbi:hypothetical protein P389DRAFT_193478 [Cystobasidium minutum MCA 4210]|uniref:uncharacterized protein n=1 Tax=Cystobasidium minutum MCA 4210 TaxID=1397322 RepID=UPI0034CD6B88|eukprot:jgi/Rhomi1/193478/gm1.1692_g